MDRMDLQLLRSLLKKEMSFWQLIGEQEGSLREFVSRLNEWLEKGLVEDLGGRIALTDRGWEWARGEGLAPFTDFLCPACGGRGFLTEAVFPETLKKFREISGMRPEAVSEYDQGYVKPEITVARVAALYRRGDLEGRELFILGDDDLTSLAAGLTGMPSRIVVAEIDARILDFINETAYRYGLNNITTLSYDVQEPLPEELQERFDLFFTDPVETLPGITLFLSRGAQSLKGAGCSGYFGLTSLEASRMKWAKIQKRILEMNFCITDIVHKFHRYLLEEEGFLKKDYPLVQEAALSLEAPDCYWYVSNLFRLEAVDSLSPYYTKKTYLGRELYFDDESYATLP